MVSDRKTNQKIESANYKTHKLPLAQYTQNKNKYITTVEAAESLGITYSYFMKLKYDGKLGDIYNFGGRRLFVKAEIIEKLKNSGTYGSITIKRIKKKISEKTKTNNTKQEADSINTVGDSVEVKILIPAKDYKALNIVLELSNRGDINAFVNSKIKEEIKKIESLFSSDK